MNNSSLVLDKIPALRSKVYELKHSELTEIQQELIPLILEGKDALAIAKTGSGKTAAFALPILQSLIDRFTTKSISPNKTKSLILTPTRELASQTIRVFESYLTDELKEKFNLGVVFGGVSKTPQINFCNIGLDILVATPGRLLDLADDQHIEFDECEYLVLDEADMMLDMGFMADVERVLELLPRKKQTTMLSATMPKGIERLAENLLVKPIKVEVSKESSTAENISQKLYTVEKADKPYLLNWVLEDDSLESVLVFCKTKFGAERIIEDLEKTNISAQSLHSHKSQGAREKSLAAFKNKEVRVLVATDIAARGIDIKKIDCVINYNLPEDPRSYVHRIGRTARAEEKGIAISFCVEAEVKLMKSIGKLIGEKVEVDSAQPFHKEISFAYQKSAKEKRTIKLKKSRRKG